MTVEQRTLGQPFDVLHQLSTVRRLHAEETHSCIYGYPCFKELHKGQRCKTNTKKKKKQTNRDVVCVTGCGNNTLAHVMQLFECYYAEYLQNF